MIRAVVKEQIVLRVSRSALHYINENRIKLDRFKFMSKFIVKKDLMNDMDIHKAMLEHAKEKGIRIDAAEKLVEDYIEEIVPFFNLLSYYKFGWWVANTLLNFLYEVVIDHENAEKLKKIPEHNAVVFVMNHRSNVDYVLVAYMLSKNVSISYAVGEWARVWPLEYIFKSFGSYFLRRRYRENLYHTVLEKYIQLISIQGVTQGIFIEGGLTRDGRFRDTKVGVIDYIMKIKKNPEFRGDVIFVPVGINYDWVLEDRTLIDEWKRGKEKSGLKGNVVSFSRIVVKIPYLFIGNTLRWMTGRLKHHGYASVSFGQPISASEFINQKEKNFFTRERYDRLGVIKQFADWLLYNIGEVIPVTPVCLIALALELLQKELLTYDELVHKVALLKAKMKNDGRRIVIGKAFQSTTEGFRKLENEEFHRKKELVSFEKELLDIDEAKTMTDVACDLLQRRRIVNMKNGIIKINKSKKSLIQYYANSLIHLVQ
ncbi:MAG: 1-acyl-sn-glycerol-3-phosphate acyltransferase [Spirochaetes bacterium]|nr:1-acyl-sn-glycerol-3-phosphate acyltransferase [Spirochaetota bacterium]